MLVEPWRVTLLGSLKAEQGPQAITRFRTRKAASLFAFLACYPRRAHSREEVTERFWPDDEPDTARAKLRLALASLRRPLEPPGTPTGSVLYADRTHLRLNPEAIETDVAAFEAGLRAARQSSAIEEQRALFMRAAQRYTGDLLPGDYEEWACAERERLHESYVGALWQVVELSREQNDPNTAIEYAKRVAAADALREDAHLALIRLYIDCGRTSDAARQYRELCSALHNALGIAPGPDVQALASTLPPCPPDPPAKKTLRKRTNSVCAIGSSVALAPPQSPDAASLTQVSVPSVVSAPPSRPDLRLPLFLTHCFGREEDVHILAAMLRADTDKQQPERLFFTRNGSHEGGIGFADITNTRLVTLTGTGGAGKTRLAVETARHIHAEVTYPVAFVPLADAADDAQALRAIANALRLPPAPDTNPLAHIAASLKDTPALLVLDNFEQLLPSGADLVHSLLARAPGLRCLVTSRQHLGLSGERVFAVSPLAASLAMQMFVDRAQSVRPDFQLTPRNTSVVHELCARLEGIPLAIEMAAAWAGTLTPNQMLERLAHRFELLVSRKNDHVPRHKTLHATLAWSCDLLPADLQTLFARLSVFRGGWRAEAAQAVGEEKKEWENGNEEAKRISPFSSPLSAIPVLNLLAQLRERSLITAEETNDGTAMRFRFLESVREFAEGMLSPAQREAAGHAHANYFLDFAEEAAPNLNGPEQAAWFSALEQEINNLRAALAWFASQETGVEAELRLACAMRVFWRTRGYLTEARQWLDAVAARSGSDAYPALLCTVLTEAGLCAGFQGDMEPAFAHQQRALELARSLDDGHRIAASLNSLGNIAKRARNYDEARRLFEEAIAITRQTGNRQLFATAIGNLGNVAKEQGGFEEARDCYEQCLTAHRESGNKQGESIALYNLAGMYAEKEDWITCAPLLSECLTVCQEIGDLLGIVYALETFGHMADARAQSLHALRLYAASARLRKQLGAPLSPMERDDMDGRLASLREQVGNVTYENAWSADAETPLRQIILFALDVAL